MSNNYILTSSGYFVSEDELYHYGIKGMKWGIRKYQNEDGSLTSAGKSRYATVADAKEAYRKAKKHQMINTRRLQVGFTEAV